MCESWSKYINSEVIEDKYVIEHDKDHTNESESGNDAVGSTNKKKQRNRGKISKGKAISSVVHNTRKRTKMLKNVNNEE